MMNFVAVSTSARNAAYELYNEEAEVCAMEERAWAERKALIEGGLWELNLYNKSFWELYDVETDDIASRLTVTVTRENADALEAEIAEKRARWEEEDRQSRALLRRLEAELEEHPNDSDLWSFYSDVHKDVYGFRPRW